MTELVEANNHSIDAEEVQRALVIWGAENFRPYPWRCTTDPYRILVAEAMLHRTQATQVLPVYERFVLRYPTVEALAAAPLDELHHALYSLGLRWRINLLHRMARQLVDRFGGEVPREMADLLQLPGVSEYIASAVRCFAWNLRDPIIDTNTVRVTGRLFNLPVNASSRRNRLFRHLIAALVPSGQPRDYNYALLDLADRVCTSKRPPDHAHCPLLPFCAYGQFQLSVTTSPDRSA